MANQNNEIRFRLRPFKKVKIGDERFATPNDIGLMSRARWKHAIIKILVKIQAYHIFEKIKRNKYCQIPISKYIKDYHHVKQCDKIINDPCNQVARDVALTTTHGKPPTMGGAYGRYAKESCSSEDDQ